MWTQKGDFSLISNGWVALNRHVEYTNEASNAIIHKLELMGYQSGGFGVAITPKDPSYYPRLKKAITDSGFNERGSDNILMFFADLEQTAFFIKAACSEDPLFEEIREHVERDLGFDLSRELPKWIRVEKITDNSDFMSSFKKETVYKNTDPSAIIERLNLWEYNNGEIKVKIIVSDKERYDDLQTASTEIGFPDQLPGDALLGGLVYSSPDKEQIALFIQAVCSKEPFFSHISAQVGDSLGVDLNLKSELPQEILKRGNIADVEFDSRANLIRNESYVNMASNAIIRKLEIFGYRDGHFEVEAQTKDNKSFDELKREARANGFKVSDRFKDKTIRLAPDGKESIISFIRMVCSKEPLFESINSEVEKSLNIITSLESRRMALHEMERVSPVCDSLKEELEFGVMNTSDIFGMGSSTLEEYRKFRTRSAPTSKDASVSAEIAQSPDKEQTATSEGEEAVILKRRLSQ